MLKLNLVSLEHQRDALKAITDNISMMSEADKAGKGFGCKSKIDEARANPLIAGAFCEESFIDIKMETGTGKTYVYTRAMYELRRRFGLFKFIIVVPSLAIKEGTSNFIKSEYARNHFETAGEATGEKDKGTGEEENNGIYAGLSIDFLTIKSGDFSSKKGKRKTIPTALTTFCDATSYEAGNIECLLISDVGFLNSTATSLFKNDYDQTLFGGVTCPIDALSLTRPVVIIDEPHRFKKTGKTYTNIMTRIKPELIIRFGATFPLVEQKKSRIDGSGASKEAPKVDYFRGRPQYELDGRDAFNKNLVKGVTVNSIQLEKAQTVQAKKYTVESATKTELVVKCGDEFPLVIKDGDPISELGASFQGDITYDGANRELSNGLPLKKGTVLIDGVFSDKYQASMIKVALDRHFETEAKNFLRKVKGDAKERVKTICLFFIDSIDAYRKENGVLKCAFEKALKEKLKEMLEKYPARKYPEYHDYLQATMNNIKGAHGGYFADDWGKIDSSGNSIGDEVNDILHKERTLTFKKEDGSWNIRRFFFSKWTLREGWDNPNVFTICKLRSSGSEISKVQEVGRGLRLPVDETGRRLKDKDEYKDGKDKGWMLNYIVGCDEDDFIKKLTSEIEATSRVVLNKESLTDDMFEAVCKIAGVKTNDAKDELWDALNGNDENHKFNFKTRVIRGSEHKFTEGGYDALIDKYPDLANMKLKAGVITKYGDKPKDVTLKKENWEQIREFWKAASARYMIVLDSAADKGDKADKSDKADKNDKATIENVFEESFVEALNSKNVFCGNESLSVTSQTLQTSEDSVFYTTQSESIENESNFGKMEYGDFVKKIAERTNIPLAVVHDRVWKRLREKLAEQLDRNGGGSEDSEAKRSEAKRKVNAMINSITFGRIIHAWQDCFAKKFCTKYRYSKLDFYANVSVFKDGEGFEFVDEIARGMVGDFGEELDAGKDGFGEDYKKRQLYEIPPILYDSEDPEHRILQIKPDSRVLVFGKIPRKAIQIPKITGGTTTPDFIYVIQPIDKAGAQSKEGEEQSIKTGTQSKEGEGSEEGSRLYLLLEAKSKDMRSKEEIAVKAQERLFVGGVDNADEAYKIFGGKFKVRHELVTSGKEVEEILRKCIKG